VVGLKQVGACNEAGDPMMRSGKRNLSCLGNLDLGFPLPSEELVW
jgi:hypothetical protein